MHDKGYVFAGPKVIEKRQTLKTGRTLVAYHQKGIIVSCTKGDADDARFTRGSQGRCPGL